MNERTAKNKSFTDNKQSIGMSKSSRSSSSSKLQPEKIMLTIEMMESDDEDEDDNENYLKNDNPEEEEINKSIDQDVEVKKNDNITDTFNVELKTKLPSIEGLAISLQTEGKKSFEKSQPNQNYHCDKIDRNNELKLINNSSSRYQLEYGRMDIDSIPKTSESLLVPEKYSRTHGSSSVLEATSLEPISSSYSSGKSSASSGIPSLNTGILVTSQNQIHDLLTGQKHKGPITSATIHPNKQSNSKYEQLSTHSANASNVTHKPDPGIINTNTFQSSLNSAAINIKSDSGVVNQAHISQNTSSHHLPLETPIKHQLPTGSMRPVPSYSHRNLMQTPQSKNQANFSCNKSYVQTPGTIFSHWQNILHTPVQNSGLDRGSGQGSSIVPKQESYWCKSTERKGVRRPLAETMIQEPRTSTDNVKYVETNHEHHEIQNQLPLESKNYLQKESQVYSPLPNKTRVSEKSSLENQNCPTSETYKRTHIETQNRPIELPNNGQLSQTSKSQESKENIYPTFRDSFEKKEESSKKSSELILENNQINKLSKSDSSTVKEAFCNLQNINNKVNVVASVPSSINKIQVGKNLVVKGVEYLILDKVGEGMSGVVYRVRNLSNSELRAIKCVDLSKMDKENAQSCIQEITMLSKLQGPSIVQMFDYEINKHMIYVVLEMGDTDLSRLLKSITAEKTPPLTMVLYYWTEMLSAVKYIHDNGVIHSDLKPANFLLVKGRLKLIDFGIASTINGDMTSVVKNTTCGTLNYISPEALVDIGESPSQHSKYKISCKSDVWSLGCILYSLVYGRTPFQHIRQYWAKINAIVNPASKISFTQPPNADPIPPVLIDVMKKCLQHNPKARPSVEQLLQIHYIPIEHPRNVPEIPPTIIMKIKNALNDEEWHQFIEIMEKQRKP